MSVELIALVISTITMLLGFVAVVGWLVNRTDRQFERLDQNLSSRIDRLAADVDGVKRELTEVKIAVARIEGPPRHLLIGR